MPALSTPPAIVGTAEVCPNLDDEMKLTDELRKQYADRFASLKLNDRRNELAVITQITQINRGINEYQRVAAATAVPWYVIALIHMRECNGNWKCHLHNGDPLASRTVNVPANRPVTGNPPFSWFDSAVDAITYEAHAKGWDGEWSLPATLFKLEQYNGLGYAAKGVPSPYLWSGSNAYRAGKFVKDHVYDPEFIDKQLGVALVLRRMVDQKIVSFPAPTP
jgi:lysozyme family protein